MIAPFSFAGSLFSDSIALYAVNNSGGWYDFGFVLGTGFLSGGGSSLLIQNAGIDKRAIEKIEDRGRQKISRVSPAGYFAASRRSSIKIRLANTAMRYKYFINVAKDLENVDVSKTEDDNQYVIKFTDSKGNTSSLWLHGNEVAEITY